MLQDTQWLQDIHMNHFNLEAQQRRALDAAIERLTEIHLNAHRLPMPLRISAMTQSRRELRDRIYELVETARRAGR